MANTYIAIATTTVGSGGAASIDFTSIPGTYTDLKLVASIRYSGATVANNMNLQLNGSTTNFSWRVLYGSGSAAASANGTNNGTADINGASSTASTFTNYEMYIPNYAGSNNKSFSVDSVTENNATESYAEMWAHLWSNSAAITSITLLPSSGTFVQYSTATLYGIKKD